MKLSCVLPTYNAQATIADAIRSLNDQMYKYHELIIIDDCSTDETAAIIRSMLKEGDKIKVIGNNKRMGAAHCRNLGNSMATGDIIVVCDADYNHKERLEAINEFFETSAGDVFYSGYQIMLAENMFAKYQVPVVKWDFQSKCTICHPTVAYKKEWADKCKYHELSTETDLFEFMLLDMERAGAKVGCAVNVLLTKIEGNTTRNMEESKRLKAEMYEKYEIQGVQL